MKITGNNGHFKSVKDSWFWGHSASYFKYEKVFKKYDVISYYKDIFKNIKRNNNCSVTTEASSV